MLCKQLMSKNIYFILLFLSFLVHNSGMRDILHSDCMDDVDWKRLEVGLKQALQVVCVFQVKVRRGITQCSPSGLEPKPHTSEALTGQYLNVCQRKLGTIIIQTFQSVHILQLDSAVTSYCPSGTFCIPSK